MGCQWSGSVLQAMGLGPAAGLVDSVLAKLPAALEEVGFGEEGTESWYSDMFSEADSRHCALESQQSLSFSVLSCKDSS